MNLRNLSNNELLQETKKIVVKEREVLIEVLHHLKEVDHRKLYLEIGFPSLWAYMTIDLKFSEAAAQRRIEAMRAIRELPVLEEKISSGALSISNVAKIQTILRQDKKKTGQTTQTAEKLRLFESLEHKSQKEADFFLASEFPDALKIKESVKIKSETENELRLSVSNEFRKKLDLAKSLISHKNPNASLVETIEAALDILISKKDLAREPAQKANPQKKSSPEQSAKPAHQSLHSPPQPPLRRLKRLAIPAKVKREIWQNAKGQCEFATAHRRCESRYQLEVDHQMPVAFGGGNEIENLRLYCRDHNRYEARKATLL